MVQANRKSNLTAWVVCLTASLFFFYEFIQMTMLNTISSYLLHDLGVDATKLSLLASSYFVANVIFLFLAGALLDRFSVKKVILVSLALCIFGTALFAMSDRFYTAMGYRFLTGIGSAFCFLSVIRLATRWFCSTRLASVVGLVVTIGMLGGVVAQKPLSLLVHWLGWRQAIIVDAGLGILIFIVILIFVRDCPPQYEVQRKTELLEIFEMGYWRSFRLAFSRWQNWLGGIYACLMNLPVIILGGLWGVMYLVKAQGIPIASAPEITQMLFLGTIVGSPLIGWISDTVRLRRAPMVVGALMSVMAVIVLVGSVNLPEVSLLALFFFIGFLTSSQVLSYSVVAESSMPAITAMSVSVVNISVQGGLALFEPVFGFLMDLHHRVILHSQTHVYTRSDFDWAMMLFPVGIVIAALAAIALDETRCRRRFA